MKSIRGFALGLVAGIAIAISTVGLAQTTKPAAQTPKAESCCASCCCQGDSCAMHAGDKDHAQQMKQGEHMKAHEGGCCCCGGDSCNMQMKMKAQEKQN